MTKNRSQRNLPVNRSNVFVCAKYKIHLFILSAIFFVPLFGANDSFAGAAETNQTRQETNEARQECPAGDAPLASEPTNHALILSLENYSGLEELNCSVNDLRKLKQVFETRLNAAVTEISNYDVSLQYVSARRQRDQILERISRFLLNPKLTVNDCVFFYMGVHGIVYEGKLRLVVGQYFPREIMETTIPVETIKDLLNQCGAGRKVLILDSCYSGMIEQERTLQKIPGQVDMYILGRDLASPDDAERSTSSHFKFTVLVSSSGKEESWVWPQKKTSLFTYWLVEGLKGFADQNMDRRIDIQELASYTNVNVTQTSRSLQKQQTPIVINEDLLKNWSVPICAVSLSETASDLSEQLDAQMRINGFNQICFPEFMTIRQSGDASAADPDLAIRLPDEICRRMMALKREFCAPYVALNIEESRQFLFRRGLTRYAQRGELDVLGSDASQNPLQFDGVAGFLFCRRRNAN